MGGIVLSGAAFAVRLLFGQLVKPGGAQAAFERTAGDIGLVVDGIDGGALNYKTIAHFLTALLAVGHFAQFLIFACQGAAYPHNFVGAIGKCAAVLFEVILYRQGVAALGRLQQFVALLRGKRSLRRIKGIQCAV